MNGLSYGIKLYLVLTPKSNRCTLSCFSELGPERDNEELLSQSDIDQGGWGLHGNDLSFVQPVKCTVSDGLSPHSKIIKHQVNTREWAMILVLRMVVRRLWAFLYCLILVILLIWSR